MQSACACSHARPSEPDFSHRSARIKDLDFCHAGTSAQHAEKKIHLNRARGGGLRAALPRQAGQCAEAHAGKCRRSEDLAHQPPPSEPSAPSEPSEPSEPSGPSELSEPSTGKEPYDNLESKLQRVF